VAGVILAQLEVFHSRPVAPTRRLALGYHDLPVDPAPGTGVGALLLGAVAAANVARLEPELFDDLDSLAVEVGAGVRITQPRLRHRLQTDRVGLLRSHHRVVGKGDELRFELDERATPAQSLLGVIYAAGRLASEHRPEVINTVRRGLRWTGQIDQRLVHYLVGHPHNGRAWSVRRHHDPVAWALRVLELPVEVGAGTGPARHTIQRRFRELLRQAHPDHGGEPVGAALRISELNEARRILLAR
jgi:hypothetical protein